MEENQIRDAFLDNIDSKMNVNINYEKKEVDLSWIDKIEETIRYIDNILRNPKKFIINEQEIVKIERSKKATVESIIHLTQHTNYIQDFNEKTGDVKPSKILNINKEESLDTYENRFIYTLIKQIAFFIDVHSNDVINSNYCNDEKGIEYKAKTELNKEKINISLSINSSNSKKNNDIIENNSKERLEKIKKDLKGFMTTDLVKTLDKLHVAIVRPPIRKTNVILKNPNFKKAEELWNFFQNYDNKNFVFEKDKRSYPAIGEFKSKFDESFLINYLSLNYLSKSEKKKIDSQLKVISVTIQRIIENILDYNENITKQEFNALINKEFKKAKEKVKANDTIIKNIFNDRFQKLSIYLEESGKNLEVIK